MRGILFVAPVIASMLGAVATHGAAQTPDTARVRIGGSAQVTIQMVPTRAVMYLLIEGTAAESRDAVAQVARTSQDVLDTLRRTGGANELTLVQYGVVPTPVTYPTPATNARNGYTSRAAVRFTTSLSSVQALTAAAFARGASASAPPQFVHEGLDSAIVRAIEEATSIARQRAEAIARGLGGRLGALLGFDTHPNTFGYSQPASFPPPQQYDHQGRPVPEIRYSVSVNGSWVFIPR